MCDVRWSIWLLGRGWMMISLEISDKILIYDTFYEHKSSNIFGEMEKTNHKKSFF